jgi:hypothetical protein
MAKSEHHLPHSSSLSHCDYDDETKEMHITFASGGRHKFKNVDKEVYDGLTKAESPGKYFHMHIRKKHDSEKVD